MLSLPNESSSSDVGDYIQTYVCYVCPGKKYLRKSYLGIESFFGR